MKLGKEIWDDREARDEYVDSMLWSQEIFREKFYDLTYEELPDWIRNNMETRPNKTTVIETLTVGHGKWFGRDGVEYYEVIPEFQITGDFNKGDKVRVTVEKILVQEEK